MNSRLSQLPDELDDYTVQFKGDQIRLWLQPNDWTIDDGSLILSYFNNGGGPFTVDGLRSLLGGDTTDSYGNSVSGDMEVWLKHPKTAKRYRPLDINFSISHDKELIVITMDDDGTFDGYNEDYGNTNDDNEEADSTYTEYGDDDEEEVAGNDDDNTEYGDGNDNTYDNGNKNETEGNVEVIDQGDKGGEEDDDGPEHDYDPSRSGSDLDQAFLETANDLFERLDELPKKCNDFLVRFTAANSGNWIQPEEWHIDDEDGSLIFGCIEDGEDHDDEELTIADLKDILTGGRDDGDTGVEEDTPIYIDDPESDDYFRPLDEYFTIRWKQQRVEIPMIEDCGNDDDEDEDDCDADGDEENYDEDNEDEDEDEEDGDDEGGGEDEEDEDGENQDDEEEGGNGDDFARRAASGLVLGLMLENGRRRRNADRRFKL